VSGIRWLFISNDCRVFRIPKPKNWVYKPVKELSGQEVLEVILYYETRDRKPFKLLRIEFDRIRLDPKGKYVFNDEDRERGMYNFLEFELTTPEKLANSDRPLAIPIAPVTPLPKEKAVLYAYLKGKLPILAKEAPLVLENAIQFAEQTHQKFIKLIKQAKKLKEGKYARRN
jgi:hypothetical protein